MKIKTNVRAGRPLEPIGYPVPRCPRSTGIVQAY